MVITDIIQDEKQRGAITKLCDCYHPWSDKKHGKGRRVHNHMKNGGWRCTTCGKEK